MRLLHASTLISSFTICLHNSELQKRRGMSADQITLLLLCLYVVLTKILKIS
jgi:hypothetical protein